MLPPREPATPAWRWLYASIRSEILAGRLLPGARLPATRDLAAQYGLSRGTIVGAFEELKSEGHVEGTTGSGTYVSRTLPEEFLRIDAAPRPRTQPVLPERPRRHFSSHGKRVRLFPNFKGGPTRAFRTNLPTLDLFPSALWAQVASRRMRRLSASLLMGCDPMGYQPLREAVAGYLSASRGVKCVPEQIAIVSGTQEALHLAARLFLDPGDRVCMEDPGYPGAAMSFEAAGAAISRIGLDEEGMKVDRRRLKGSRLVYVTPGHQFPLGITMSLRRRLQLLEWAGKSGALIFEDDYDSEFRYSGRPVPALQGLDRHGVVLFAGSFSKVLFPSLRLGYLVAPPDLTPHIEAMISTSSRHASLPDQAVLCDFIVEGHFGRHLRRMREIYANRLSVLLESARKELDGLIEISSIAAGLQTIGWLKQGIGSESAAQAAAARNVDVTPVAGWPRPGLQLGFAAVDTQEIQCGVRDLAVALARLA